MKQYKVQSESKLVWMYLKSALIKADAEVCGKIRKTDKKKYHSGIKFKEVG